jgi:hypothetical protein
MPLCMPLYNGQLEDSSRNGCVDLRTDGAPSTDAGAEVLCGRQPLHKVCVWHLEDEKSKVEKPRQCAILLSCQVGIFTNTHDGRKVHCGASVRGFSPGHG